MNREGLFMVILGDTGSPYHDLMEERIADLGEVNLIMDNTYVLKVKDLSLWDKEKIRDIIAGAEFCYCIVIDMTKFASAWSLKRKDSEYMKTFFEND